MFASRGYMDRRARVTVCQGLASTGAGVQNWTGHGESEAKRDGEAQAGQHGRAMQGAWQRGEGEGLAGWVHPWGGTHSKTWQQPQHEAVQGGQLRWWRGGRRQKGEHNSTRQELEQIRQQRSALVEGGGGAGAEAGYRAGQGQGIAGWEGKSIAAAQ